LNRRPDGRSRSLLGACCFFGACAATAAEPVLEEERERAAAAAAAIESQWPTTASGPAAAIVRSVGARLGATPEARSFRWRFTIVRDRSANAFAVGDGRIYVHEGAVSLAADEAELAAILAHEMGHELAGHFRASAPRDLSSWWASLFRPKSVERPPRPGPIREYDVNQELEADRISLRLLREAGYDIRAAVDMARRVATAGLSRHLGDAERVAALERLVRDLPGGGQRDSEEFRHLRREVLRAAE
jgi:predicted Zn-dependent protease